MKKEKETEKKEQRKKKKKKKKKTPHWRNVDYHLYGSIWMRG